MQALKEPVLTMASSAGSHSVYAAGADASIQRLHLTADATAALHVQDAAPLRIAGEPMHHLLIATQLLLNESEHHSITASTNLIRVPTLFAGTASVAVRADARVLLSGHWDGTVRLFDTKRLKPLAILRYTTLASTPCRPAISCLLPSPH